MNILPQITLIVRTLVMAAALAGRAAAAADEELPPAFRPLTGNEMKGVSAARRDAMPEVRAWMEVVLAGKNGYRVVHPDEPRPRAHPSREDWRQLDQHEMEPPAAPEAREKNFAKVAADMKTASLGSLFEYFAILGNPAARAQAADVAAFVRYKEDEDGWVGRDAALALAAMGAREFADELAAAVPEVVTETRFGIMRALEQFGDPRCVDVARLLLTAEEVLDFNGRGFGKSNHVQDAAITLLMLHRPPGLESDLRKLLSSPSPQARLGGIRALRELKDVASAAALVPLLGRDQPPGIRSHALLALGEFHAMEFVPQVGAVLGESLADEQDGRPPRDYGWGSHQRSRSELQEPEYTVRSAAVRALGDLGAEDFVPQIAAELDRKFTRVEALDALVRIKSDRAAAPVARTLLRPSLPERWRGALLQALVSLKARAEARHIVRLFLPAARGGVEYENESDRDEVSLKAAEALAVIDPEVLREAVPELLQAEGISKTKTGLLSLLKDMDAVPFLDAVRGLLLEKEPVSVRLEAAGFLFSKRLMTRSELMVYLARAIHAGMWWEPAVTGFLDRWHFDPETARTGPVLQHGEDAVVLGGLTILHRLKRIPPVELLKPLLSPDKSLEVRLAALGMLEKGAAETAAKEAIVLLADSDTRVVLQALDLLDGKGSANDAGALMNVVRHPLSKVRTAALGVLINLGGNLTDKDLATLLEMASLHSEQRGGMLVAAWLFFARHPQLAEAIPFLGGRTAATSPPLPRERAAARATLDALIAFYRIADPSAHSRALWEAGSAVEQIVGNASWEYDDEAYLVSVADALQKTDILPKRIVAVRAMAAAMSDRHPARIILRGAVWGLALQVFLWVLILTLYPWSRLAQWMVWTRWTRRCPGFGWVGPAVLQVRWLRERMWRPFREALVPPGEVVSFDEWTFFDSVKVTPAGGGESLPALRVFADLRGLAVLRGESGLGKTTLLHALAAQAQRPAALLRAAECGGGLLTALRFRLPRHAQGDARFLRALVQRGAPDILVDAVHETLPEVRARLTEEVNALPGANVLLTTQPLEWTPPQGAVTWQLEPLQARDIAPFLLKQGTAAVEAAGAGSLAERQRKFAARTAEFLQHLESLPPESAEAAALRRMLGNPMEAVLAAELLAAGQTPDPNRLLEQRMEHLEEDYTAQCGDQFPAAAFAEHLRTWRASGAPLLRLEVFAGVAAFLAKHRLLRKSADGAEAWRFRHDKVMEWFLRAA